MSGQPFLFDNHVFDDDPLIGMEDKERPEFSKTELEAATKKFYEDGKKAGLEEAQNSLRTQILGLLQKIERDMTILFAAEYDRYEKYEQESVHLAYEILKKMFPFCLETFSEQELVASIKKAVESCNTPEKIRIELHEDMIKPLEAEIKDTEQTLEKNIDLVSNNALQPYEARILWPDGGIILNRNQIAEKTFGIVKEALAERGVSVHDDEIIEEENIEKSETSQTENTEAEPPAGETQNE